MSKTNRQFSNVHHGVGDGAYESELKDEDSSDVLGEIRRVKVNISRTGFL